MVISRRHHVGFELTYLPSGWSFGEEKNLGLTFFLMLCHFSDCFFNNSICGEDRQTDFFYGNKHSYPHYLRYNICVITVILYLVEKAGFDSEICVPAVLHHIVSALSSVIINDCYTRKNRSGGIYVKLR